MVSMQRTRPASRSAPPVPTVVQPAPAYHTAHLSRSPAWAHSRRSALQPKLTINQPGDAYEQEADRVADQVMRMPAPQVQRKCACGGEAGPDGECAACKARRLGVQRQVLEEDDELQMQAAAPAPTTPTAAPPAVQQVLSAPGRPLDAGTRAYMEPRFGHDFSQVRVHTDAPAAESARAINARAYTVGRDVVFGAGQYAPGTGEGQRLLAHELVHVVQQGGGDIYRQSPLKVDHTTDVAKPINEHSIGPVRQELPMPTALRPTLAQTPLIMRDFDSTMRICHRLLKSRTFSVNQGTVTITLYGDWLPDVVDRETVRTLECGTSPYYYVTLTRKGLIFDSEIATHPVPFGHRTMRTWTGLANGTYYLTIWTNSTNPYCCLEGDISVSTSTPDSAGSGGTTGTGTTSSLPDTACYDGDILYVNKGGRIHSCPALTGTVGDPTPAGRYCIRHQGEAQIGGGLRGRVLQDRDSWFLLEPQFPTTRYRMQLHPGRMSAGCITVMDRRCFDNIASILNSGGTVRATGYDGYPPGNPSGTENPAREVDCVGMLTVVANPGDCMSTP